MWPEGLFDELDRPLSAVARVRRVGAKAAVPPAPPPATVKPPKRRDRAALIPEAELVSVQELMAALGLSRSTLHRLRATPAFPQPLQISERRVAFRTAEIREWLAAKERARRTWNGAAPEVQNVRRYGVLARAA